MTDWIGYGLWRKPNRKTTWPIIQVLSTPKMILNYRENWTQCRLWQKPDRTMTWLIVQMWFMSNMKLSYYDQLDQVQSITKTRQDNDMTICQKRYWTIKTYQTECDLWWKPDKTMIWLIFHVWSTLKTKLSCYDWSNWVQSVMKTRQDNDMIDYRGAVYIENDIKLSWFIKLGAICDEHQTWQRRDRLYRCGLRQNWNYIVETYMTRCSLWWKLDKTITWPIV